MKLRMGRMCVHTDVQRCIPVQNEKNKKQEVKRSKCTVRGTVFKK